MPDKGVAHITRFDKTVFHPSSLAKIVKSRKREQEISPMNPAGKILKYKMRENAVARLGLG